MAPLRRSGRKKRASALDEERCTAREKKRRETLTPHEARSLPSASTMLKDLPLIVSGISSEDINSQLAAVSRLLRLLSIVDGPPIDEVVRSGVVSPLVELLKTPRLQCGAARILKNICAGTSENVKMVVDSGALPVFVDLLESSSDYHIVEQAIWVLGNIAGDSAESRDLVLGSGALKLLLTRLNEHEPLSMLRIGTWTLSNFCEGITELPMDQLESAIPVFASLISMEDEVILTEACWALSYIGEKNPTLIEACMYKQIALLLLHTSPSVVFPTVRTVLSLSQGPDMQVERVVGCGAYVYLMYLLTKKAGIGFIQSKAAHAVQILNSRMDEIMRKKCGRQFD